MTEENTTDLQDHPLSVAVQHEIEQLLLSGELQAGSRINEKQIAEKLGVSRAPVREATRALEQVGLVQIIRNRGVFVRNVSLKDVIAIFDIRIALARIAASEAARRATATSVRVLADLVEQMNAASSVDEYLAHNSEFHAQVFLLSDNPRLAQLDLSLSKELRLYRLRGLRSAGSVQASNAEHQAIFTAIAERNPDLAGRLFEQHLIAVRDRFLAAVDQPAEPQPRKRGRPRKHVE